jgi:hypothetical protein
MKEKRQLFTERQLIIGSYPIHLIFLLLGISTHASLWLHTILSMFSIYNWMFEDDVNVATGEGEGK